MRRRLLLVLTLWSCSSQPRTVRQAPPAAPAPAREMRPAAAPATEAGVRVEIIQAGARPRRALRYRFSPDRLGTLVTAFDTDIATRSADGAMVHLPSPPMEMELEMTSLEVLAGVAHATDRLTRIDVTTSPSDATDEKSRQTIRERLRPMVGMTGSMDMDERGRLLGMTWNAPDSLPPEVRALLDSMNQSSGDMVVPLPDEPVGLGAEWQSIHDTKLMGVKLTYTSRFKLEALDGDRLVLRSAIDISAGNQPLTLPGLPAGTTAELLACDGDGGGEVELDLGWIAPTRIAVQSRTEMTMEVTSGGQKTTVALQARMQMEAKRR